MEILLNSSKFYLCIDLKCFYASVECVERNLDPFSTNLVVADLNRTEKTVCLAISPAMKKLGVRNRCRVFEIPKHIKYITAKPRMKLYMEKSAEIYGIYLKYIDKNDIFVYSIDEVFIDITKYLKMYNLSPIDLGKMIIKDVFLSTGITASCGVGTNLYLAKIAMDILAKHNKENIAFLDENLYKEKLWDYKPITDFWRIGEGISSRLEKYGIDTMRKISNCGREFLFKLFGIDSELILDHANGVEPTTLQDIKSYHSKANSISSGQVLSRNYNYSEALIIVTEMLENLTLELVDKGLVTKSITLHLSYDRKVNIKSAHGTITMPITTSSVKTITEYGKRLYNEIIDKRYSIRKINVTFNNVLNTSYEQYDFLTDPKEKERELTLQKTVIGIKNKYGKNALLKGINLNSVGTMRERNLQVGGHNAGYEDDTEDE